MGTKLTTLLLVCAPLLVHARPDQNAYLNHSVTSVSGLIAEIKHDPQVADRFMRHFGMSKDEVIAMVSKLHVARLDQNTRVTMFSVPEGGAIRSHSAVLRKGESVFEDAEGNLVLKLRCGNPLVGGRELTELALVPEALEGPSVMRPLAPVIDVTPQLNDAIATIITPETPTDVVELVPQDKKEIENITNNNVTNNTTYAGGGGGANLAGLLVAVPIAAFLGAAIDHHGCCCCSTPPPAPAPEPVSMTLLASGAIGLVVRRRRSRS